MDEAIETIHQGRHLNTETKPGLLAGMKPVFAGYLKEITDSVIPLLGRAGRADAVSAKCEDCNSVNSCEIIKLLCELHPDFRGPSFGSRRVEKGDHLFHSGDKLDSVYVVRAGMMKRYFHSAVGDELLAGFSQPGQVLGIEALLHGTASIAAVALEDTKVCSIPLAALASIPDKLWSAWVMSRVCDERKRERMLRLVSGEHCKPEARVAYFLLEQATGHGECGHAARRFKLLIPRREIASYLNLSVESLSHAIAHLQGAGIVQFERDYLIILEPENLLALAPPGTFTADNREFGGQLQVRLRGSQRRRETLAQPS